jgi:hypothetical protein
MRLDQAVGHLGLWFDSPVDAARAGCGDTVTPFNGVHNAGVQALSTRQFGDLTDPLSFLNPKPSTARRPAAPPPGVSFAGRARVAGGLR